MSCDHDGSVLQAGDWRELASRIIGRSSLTDRLAAEDIDRILRNGRAHRGTLELKRRPLELEHRLTGCDPLRLQLRAQGDVPLARVVVVAAHFAGAAVR